MVIERKLLPLPFVLMLRVLIAGNASTSKINDFFDDKFFDGVIFCQTRCSFQAGFDRRKEKRIM